MMTSQDAYISFVIRTINWDVNELSKEEENIANGVNLCPKKAKQVAVEPIL